MNTFRLWRTVVRLAFLVSLILTTAGPSARAAGVALTYQLNPAHDGSAVMSGFGFPLAKWWTVDLGQTVSYPLIAGGRIFVTVADNTSPVKRVVALDAATGKILWQQQIGGYYWRIDLAYENGMVFTVNTDGLMQAWDAATGAQQWQKQMPGQYFFSSPPTAVNGIVYVGGAGTGGTVYAVRETDGTVLWTASVMNGDHSSPAVTSDGVYVSYAGPQVYKFNPSGLTSVWHYDSGIEGGGGSTPVYYANRLYVRSSGSGQIFDTGTGALLSGGFTSGPAPAFDSNRMYSVSGNALTGRDVSTGTNLWAFRANYTETAAPIVVNGVVITADAGGWVHANDGVTGRLLWEGSAGAGVLSPDEHNVSGVLTGLGAGEGLLAVPAGHLLTVFANHAPLAPTNLAAVIGDAVVNLSWSAASGASTYNIKRAAASGGPFTLIGATSSTSYSDTAVTNGGTYYYVVSATNVVGDGPDSNPTNVIRPGFTISGKVTAGGVELSGVSVYGGSSMATTDPSGNYTLTGLSAGNYLVLAFAPGYSFPNQTALVGPNRTGVNFAAPVYLAGATYSISGTVTAGGIPVSGVSIYAGTGSVNTGPDGSYTLSGLAPGNYLVQAFAPGYTFADQTALVGPDRTGVNFTAPKNLSGVTYTISGRVTAGGLAVAGATVYGGPGSAVTGSDGTYTLTGLSPGNYLVQAFAPGYSFPNQTALVGPDKTGVDFNAQ